MPKLVRITTVPISLKVLLKGQMKFMKNNGFEVIMVSSDGDEVQALLEQEECPHITVPFTRKITPFKDLYCLIKLTMLLRKIKPDIVHTHTPKAGLIGMWASLLSGVPVRLHTIAGLPWMETKGLLRRLLKTMERLTAFAATEIFPNSFNQQQFLFSENIARNKMKVLGSGSSNGIDCEYFSSSDAINQAAAKLHAQFDIPENGWVWIFVGRIVKDKGIAELLDAFDDFHSQYPEDRLWLVGEEEPQLDPLEKKHSGLLHNTSFIRWCGYQKDIRPFLAASQVLLFPSYREGFPNVPLQAGAMGCMLLLSDINGCNEIVSHMDNGILIPPKKKEDLLNQMMYIRQNPELRKTMADRIQQKIRLSYNQNALWNLLLNEYRFRIQKQNV